MQTGAELTGSDAQLTAAAADGALLLLGIALRRMTNVCEHLRHELKRKLGLFNVRCRRSIPAGSLCEDFPLQRPGFKAGGCDAR